MILPRWERAEGVVDGVNTLFETSQDYEPGSLMVFVNGLCRPANADNGWEEYLASSFTMKEPPLPGDIIMAQYNVIPLV